MLIVHPVHTTAFNSEPFLQSVGVIKMLVEEADTQVLIMSCKKPLK